ncbi:MAG TPA: branched-chain amino acid ABC transporter permease, partial [Nitrospirota bacterium]|nr:branched-chain amino acid ABC transporter permease [Nitrospirota bacterium]
MNATKYMEELKHSAVIAAWFMFLTFPIMAIRVNTIENIIEWRWMNIIYVGIGSFIVSFFWRCLSGRKTSERKPIASAEGVRSLGQRLLGEKRILLPAAGIA